MSLTIELPNEVARQLAELPAEERSSFAIQAALEARRRDRDEFAAAVEQALADLEDGRNLIPFEELCERWDRERESAGGSQSVPEVRQWP